MLTIGTKVKISYKFTEDIYHDKIRELATNKTTCTISEIRDGGYLLEELKGLDCYDQEWSEDEFVVIKHNAILNDMETYDFFKPEIKHNYTTIIPIEVKKLREDAILPKYAHGYEDSGMDVYVNKIAVKENGEWVEYDDYEILHHETVLVKTGIAVSIPQGTEIQVRPNSGNSLKTMLRVANSPGTIDSGFRGEIGVIVTNTERTDYTCLSKGDKIAQLVLCPVYHANINVVDDFTYDSTNRGSNEYGSTGTIKGVK